MFGNPSQGSLTFPAALRVRYWRRRVRGLRARLVVHLPCEVARIILGHRNYRRFISNIHPADSDNLYGVTQLQVALNAYIVSEVVK